MSYIENPKTMGSGIICAIPQKGTCPIRCADCFFQSGRSYLEPLKENLPNVPSLEQAKGRVVRINDGNDSNVLRHKVEDVAEAFNDSFYNTSIPERLEEFVRPVVLTVNPGPRTDHTAYLLSPVPKNLMFVRFRTNTWNQVLCDKVVEHYAGQMVPVVLTFMAYYTKDLPRGASEFYSFRKRTLNSYYVVKSSTWDFIMNKYKKNPYVYSCGKDAYTFGCRFCGCCLREYYVTKERLRAI